MKYAYGLILIAWLAAEQILRSPVDILSIASILGVLCLFIMKERFFDKEYTRYGLLMVVLALCMYNSGFVLLLGISIIDFSYKKKYTITAILFTAATFVGLLNGSYSYIFQMFFSVLFGYIIAEKDNNERKHISIIDEERRVRYRLEQTQNQLINSKKQMEHLVEVRERNRIAQEIHDNIGHSIAGVIFQIEAAIRIMNKDKDKLESILRLCSRKLAEALELTRNTVYNIKPDKKIGIAALEKIINDCRFCEVKLEHSGDFSLISLSNLSLLEANIMELLTNASKYSCAKKILIRIDISKKNLRLYYRDDGVGCMDIQESLGISGMKDRVKNAGGTISIDGVNGFLIVCNLPMRGDEEREVESIEDSYSG